MSESTESTPAPRFGLLIAALLVVAACAAYANSFAGVFLFDDIIRIVEEERIRRLWPIGQLLSGERPMVDLSLALNYAISGLKPWSYHAFNLAVHILAGLTLFGIARRTIENWQQGNEVTRQRGSKEDRSAKVEERIDLQRQTQHWPTLTAFVVALIFLVHPLQTQSVTYVIQRGESMMGLFYLLTLYCAIRAFDSPRRWLWSGAAVAACALGMGTKAVMVTAPLIVVLYDWVFAGRGAQRSKFEVPKQRLPLYVALFATWSVLWMCGIASEALGQSSATSHVGFAYKGITAAQYAATQPGVIVKYLQLSLWPASLCLDYDWSAATGWRHVVAPAICIGVLFSVAAWLVYRRHWLGFVGAWFFVILAPTSSFVPIKDLMFEHRMYLPLAAIITALVVPIGLWLFQQTGNGRSAIEPPIANRQSQIGHPRSVFVLLAFTFALASPLACATHLRNRTYHSELAMWQDVVQKNPNNARGHLGVGVELFKAGKTEEAISWFRKALAIKDAYADGHYNLAIALAAAGMHDEAIREFHRTVELNPARDDAWVNASRSHSKLGDFPMAVVAIREALRIKPHEAEYHYHLANALSDGGDTNAALASFLAAIQLDPRHTSARINLGNLHLQHQRLKDAEAQYRFVLTIDPENTVAHINLGRTLGLQERYDEALEAFRRVPSHDPLAAEAKFGAGRALIELSRTEEAESALREALRLDPGHSGAAAELARLEASRPQN